MKTDREVILENLAVLIVRLWIFLVITLSIAYIFGHREALFFNVGWVASAVVYLSFGFNYKS